MTTRKQVKEKKSAECIVSYLTEIFEITKNKHGTLCYRGQANSNWKLIPSVMRDLRANAESQIFSELMVEAPSEFGADKSMFDKLVRAQHYSLPTRLLDVTLNPLVALYFACNDDSQAEKDGVIQIFNFSSNRVKFADSDTVSIICNLARLSDEERKEISEKFYEKRITTNPQREIFRKIPEIKRLMQFVRVEKSYFLDALNPDDLFRYFFVYPSKNNRRVIAQSGAFIAAGLLEYKSPGTSKGFDLEKLHIPAESKINILKQLDSLNINSRSMFPEVESASKYIRKKWSNS